MAQTMKAGPVLRVSFNDDRQLRHALVQLQQRRQGCPHTVHLKSRGGFAATVVNSKVSKLLAELTRGHSYQTLDIDMPSVLVRDADIWALLRASQTSLVSLRLRCSFVLWDDDLCPNNKGLGLQNLTALESFSLHLGAVRDADTLVNAVADCPKLKSVTLAHRLSQETFQKLVRKPTLETLICLENGVIDWSSTSSTRPDGVSLESLCETLQSPSSSLKSLKLPAPPPHETVDISPIATMLQDNNNNTLEHLALTICQEQDVTILAHAVQHNQVLKRLEIRGTGLVDAIVSSFSPVLPGNLWLEEFKYNGCDIVADPAIYMYVTLNKAGRKYLVEHGTRSDWAKVLISHHWNTTLVFHLLKTNPSLIKGMGLGNTACLQESPN